MATILNSSVVASNSTQRPGPLALVTVPFSTHATHSSLASMPTDRTSAHWLGKIRAIKAGNDFTSRNGDSESDSSELHSKQTKRSCSFCLFSSPEALASLCRLTQEAGSCPSLAQLLNWHVVSSRPFSLHYVCSSNRPFHLYGYSELRLLMIPGHSLPPKSCACILSAPSRAFAPTIGPAQYLCPQESLFMHMHVPASQAWPSCMFHYLTSAAEYVTSLACLSTAGSPTVFAPKDRIVAYAMNTAFPGCETPSPTPNVKQKRAFVFSSQLLQQTEACFLMTQPTWGKVLFTKATR